MRDLPVGKQHRHPQCKDTAKDIQCEPELASADGSDLAKQTLALYVGLCHVPQPAAPPLTCILQQHILRTFDCSSAAINDDLLVLSGYYKSCPPYATRYYCACSSSPISTCMCCWHYDMHVLYDCFAFGFALY